MFGLGQNAGSVKTGSTSKETIKGGVSKKENLKLVVTETYADVLMDDESEVPPDARKPVRAMVEDEVNLEFPGKGGKAEEEHTTVKTSQKVRLVSDESLMVENPHEAGK